MRKSEKVAIITDKHLDNCEQDDTLRQHKTAFTRRRRLGAKKTLHIMLRQIFSSLQLSIDHYFEKIGEAPVSKQAFSKARKGLNPDYVRKFADGVAEVFAEADDLPTYLGMRLIAIDGTDIALENSEELKEEFGCSGPNCDAATALASIAYGPLEHGIYDCQIAPYKTDERELAKLHMERLNALGLGGSLLLFDRWYPSKELLSYTLTQGFSFVMRVRKKWNLDVDRIKTQGWVTLVHQGESFRVRVLKVKLATDETETLLTNLNQKQLPIAQAGNLYWKRWGIETAYDLMKSKLQLENFSGKTVVSVKQDFYATVYLAGFAAACAADADEVIAARDAGKHLKYKRKSSQTRTIAKLRERFLQILLTRDPDIRKVLFD
ncbi:MAG: IS4 family transposase, partial [Oscillospiraceae bacterium]